MPSLMSYLTGLGLAGSVGAKAFIPVLALGLFHHTDYFELSPQWQWIASPPVMLVLAVLAVAEIVVDSTPELAEWADVVHYLPKAVVGFIAFAAATGTLDQSLLQLATSGLLGAATATGAHYLRSGARRHLRDHAEPILPKAGLMATIGEATISAGAAGAAVVAPVAGVALVGLAGAAAFGGALWMDSWRKPCVHAECGQPIRYDAVVCRHCGREQMERRAALA